MRWSASPGRRADPVEAGMAGTHASRLRGLTAEFTEYRPYRQGDDSRRLDWKLLARTDRAHLRITDERATRTTLVVLDASASMAFPATTLEKWAQACRLAIGLTAVARGEGDPAGMSIVTPQGVTRFLPGPGRASSATSRARSTASRRVAWWTCDPGWKVSGPAGA
jgi:uncharacterized protein (DUF58 family)